MTRRGFTLLELMIAVFLTAIVMTILYGVVSSTLRAEQRIDELTHGSEIGPAVLQQVRQDLDAAFLPDDKADYFKGADQKGYGGDRDRVDFVSSVVVYAADGPFAEPRFHSINELGYQVKDSPEHAGEGALYRRVDPFLDAEPGRGGELTLIADRVISFNIEFWKDAKWVTTWSSKTQKNQLPEAIKIELKMKVPDRQAEGGFAERTFATVLPLVR